MAAMTFTTSREVNALTMPATLPLGPDGILLALCAEFRRRHSVVRQMSSAPAPSSPAPTDDEAQEAAWTARQDVIDQISGLRPLTEAGRAAKAGVGVAVLLEAPRWEQNS